MTRNQKLLLRGATCGVLLGLMPADALAKVDDTWVWCDPDVRKTETVMYCVMEDTFFKDDLAAWKGFIADAAKEWSDGTSWKLVQQKDNDCTKSQIKISQDKENKGTADTKPIQRADKKCNMMVTIKMRKKSLGDKDTDYWQRDPKNPKNPDANNPLHSIKHELGHSLLLDHTDGANDIMIDTNTNVVALSDEDKKEGNASQKATIPKEEDQKVDPSSTDQSLIFEQFDITIPGGSLVSSTILGIQPLSPRSTPSYEDNLPAGVDRIIRSASYFTTDFVPDTIDTPIVFTPVAFSPPAIISCHYSTSDLTDGSNFAHELEKMEPVGRIDEASLRLLALDPITLTWVALQSSINTVDKIVSAPVAQLNTIFACAGQTVVCDVNGDRQIDRDDISAIFAARNKLSARLGDPRDADGDGIITVNDARICVNRCTNAHCAL